MFVIAGATGKTGSATAKALLQAGKKVRALARDPKKAEGLAALGAEVVSVDLADQAALGKAVAGAEGLYFLSPPDMAAKDFVAERKALTEKQVATLVAAKVPHVVLLSSIGAHLPDGHGPVRTVHNLEQQLQKAGLPSTFVRPGYFVENWGAVLHPLQQDSVLPTFFRADQPIPMVSTPDIGTVAARALLDGPKGYRAIELSGPTDPTSNDVAAAFAKLLGRPIKVIEAPLDAVVPTFTSFGISENIASLYREMYEGFGSGHVKAAPGETMRGTTPLETTLQALLG
jgi:uncharacterized protein YbjT (DUF2867 family)